jgi:hemoglobin
MVYKPTSVGLSDHESALAEASLVTRQLRSSKDVSLFHHQAKIEAWECVNRLRHRNRPRQSTCTLAPVARPAHIALGCGNACTDRQSLYEKRRVPMAATLYERLGGAEGITRLVDDAVDAHLANPAVKTRFENSKDIERSKKMSVAFFCAGAGGPESYTGKDMLTVHKGMNISEQEFIAVVDDILGAMDKNNLGEDEKKEVLAVLYSLKSQIIRV